MIFIEELKKIREKNKFKIKNVLPKDSILKNKDSLVYKIKEIKKDYYFTRNKLKKSNIHLKINNIAVEELVSSDKSKLAINQKIVDNISSYMEDSFFITITEKNIQRDEK